MKPFYINEYHINNKKIKDTKIVTLSDIHFSNLLKKEITDRIYNKVKDLKPNYIFIPGDLIDCQMEIKNKEDLERLCDFLKDLSNISKVFISLGNHELYLCKDKKSNKFIVEYPKEYIATLKEINNIYILDDESYKDDNLSITGISLDIDCYNDENCNIYNKNTMNKIIEIDKKLDNTKLNIVLMHSPFLLLNKEFYDSIKNIDYIICGHMHYGCVLPFLDKLIKNDRGIVGPNRVWFPKYTRNTLNNENDKIIMCGPVTTIHEISGNISMLNFVFPIHIGVINFKSDTRNNKKINVKKIKTYH